MSRTNVLYKFKKSLLIFTSLYMYPLIPLHDTTKAPDIRQKLSPFILTF